MYPIRAAASGACCQGAGVLNNLVLVAVLAVFGLAALLALAFGVRYVFTRQFMPYHATVLGKPWASLEPRLQFIIVGMLKVAGGGLLGYGVAMLWLLLPVQREEAWAVWAVLTMSLVVVVPILYTVVWLRRIEPTAKTPVVPCVVVLALVLAGAAAFLVR
jgi:hypothetical protein